LEEKVKVETGEYLKWGGSYLVWAQWTRTGEKGWKGKSGKRARGLKQRKNHLTGLRKKRGGPESRRKMA